MQVREATAGRREELAEVSALFKEHRFAAGETVIKEGSGGAAFYVIDSGQATVTISGEPRGTLVAGRRPRRGQMTAASSWRSAPIGDF